VLSGHFRKLQRLHQQPRASDRIQADPAIFEILRKWLAVTATYLQLPPGTSGRGVSQPAMQSSVTSLMLGGSGNFRKSQKFVAVRFVLPGVRVSGCHSFGGVTEAIALVARRYSCSAYFRNFSQLNFRKSWKRFFCFSRFRKFPERVELPAEVCGDVHDKPKNKSRFFFKPENTSVLPNTSGISGDRVYSNIHIFELFPEVPDWLSGKFRKSRGLPVWAIFGIVKR